MSNFKKNYFFKLKVPNKGWTLLLFLKGASPAPFICDQPGKVCYLLRRNISVDGKVSTLFLVFAFKPLY